MRRPNWQMYFALFLVLLSGVLYYLHYFAFHDSHHIFIYLLGDVAFVPIEVLLVTLIIHRLLTVREKRVLFQKLNMVIGAFYSEVGTDLLQYFSAFDPGAKKIQEGLVVTKEWSTKDFQDVRKRLKRYDCELDLARGDLGALREFLKEKRPFLLRLLENPNLLEHDSFTDLLWAVFHLTEELAHRKGLEGLPGTDLEHIAGDIKRAYRALISEWIDYMGHLKESYPYLFSLAIRTNPFDPEASVVVVES